MSNNKIFKFSVLIKEHHLDTFNHVNYSKYLELLEEARWEFLNAQGLGLKTIHDTGVGPIILECQIKFLKELKLRQIIVIESQVLSFEKKIGVMRQDIIDEESKLCSHAKITFGIFDMNMRKLILPTAQWLLAIGAAP